MADVTSIAVGVLTEIAKALNKQAPGRALNDKQLEVLRTLVAAAIVAEIPTAAAEATIIAQLVSNVLKKQPELIKSPQRITASVLIKEQDDTFSAAGSLGKRLKFKPFKMSDGLKSRIGDIVVNLLSDALWTGTTTVATVMMLSSAQQVEQTAVQLVLTANGVNLRILPSTDSGVIGVLSIGTSMTKIEEDGEWTRVSLMIDGTSKVGWIATKYLKAVMQG